MRQFIVLFISSLLFVGSGNLFAMERDDLQSVPRQTVSSKKIVPIGGRYAKDNFQVYYQGEVIEEASSSSFTYLGDGYGKDNWTVFYRGKVVENASPSSFEYLKDGYAKDNWNVYFRGKRTRAYH